MTPEQVYNGHRLHEHGYSVRTTMADGLDANSLRAGMLLRVSCPMIPAQVVEVRDHHVTVTWPWGRIDPDSRFRWNGRRAFGRSPESLDWVYSLFRTDPEPWHLKAGDLCRVGIPDDVFQILDVHRNEAGEDTGALPRPTTMLTVLRAELVPFLDEEDEDAGDTLALPSGAPVALEIVSGPDA